MVQRYKFESKSQLATFSTSLVSGCFQWFKGTNLKANHNKVLWMMKTLRAVSNGSKVQIWKQITTPLDVGKFFPVLFPMVQRYKFESKSQPHWLVAAFILAVSNGSKVQIWKQITTLNSFIWQRIPLFPMVQRYKFESKSQLSQRSPSCHRCCFQWFNGTNLKANHNCLENPCGLLSAVSNGSKVQIWKQITTWHHKDT